MNKVRMVNLLGAALVALTATLPVQANAAGLVFDLTGPGVSGTLNLTYEVNDKTGVLPGTSPNPVDPIGSFVVTGATGTFSDANLGISNATVSGVADRNYATPEPLNLLAPHSFSLLKITNGVPSPGGTSLGLHYDNLLYPAGSPQAASDYPFHGGIFDIYGLVFSIGEGRFVNLWSNGYLPNGKLDYGVAVANSDDLLDYTGGVALSTPEPATWALMIVGFGLVGHAMRRRQRVTVSYA